MNIVRLDRFHAPSSARAALLARIAETHALLRRQPGFVRDAVVERPDGDGVEIVTTAEWASEAAIAEARVAVRRWQEATGFDPQAFLAANGVAAVLGVFRPVATPSTAHPSTP